MKIAIFEPNFLTPKPFAASHQVLLKNQAQILANLGNEVFVLSENQGNAKPVETEGNYTVYPLQGKVTTVSSYLKPTRQKMSIFPDFFSPDIIHSAVKVLNKEIHTDVIYTCGSPFAGIFTAMLGVMTGIPTVHYVFSPFTLERWWIGEAIEGYKKSFKQIFSEFLKQTLRELPRRRFFIKWGLKHITKIIASSEYTRNSIRNLDLDIEDIRVIYPGVKIPPLVNISKEIDVPIITYFGHLRPKRGVIDLTLAFLEIVKEFPKAKLTIAISNVHELFGSTTMHYCKKLVSTHGLGSNILWKGIVNDVYSELLAPSTVIVLPQHNPSIKIIESMAAAKPVITTRVEWAPELISDGVNGYLVNVGDIGGIANKVKLLFDNFKLVEEIGKNARKTIREKCDLNKTSEEILSILTEAKYKNVKDA